mgnify:CR=1 FL=1
MRHFLNRVWGIVVDAEDENIGSREERAILLSELKVSFELADGDEDGAPPPNHNTMRLN